MQKLRLLTVSLAKCITLVVDYWCLWNCTGHLSFASRHGKLHRKSGQWLKKNFTLHSHSLLDFFWLMQSLILPPIRAMNVPIALLLLHLVKGSTEAYFSRPGTTYALLYLLLLLFANCLDCKLLLLLLLHEKRSWDGRNAIGRCLQRWHTWWSVHDEHNEWRIRQSVSYCCLTTYVSTAKHAMTANVIL